MKPTPKLVFQSIPPFNGSDHDKLRLFVASWDFWPLSLILESINAGTSSIIVASDELGDWLGILMYSQQAEAAEILNIYVPPSWRTSGIGSALVTELCAQLQKCGCSSLYLEVRPSNFPALRLYRLFGFVEVGRRKRYYQDGEDALIMKRSLS
jgi:[ribosomal protein S18]-alanine N-acetyltransferase